MDGSIMKKIICLFSIVFLAASCYQKIEFDPAPWYYDPSDHDSREALKVMSFNVRYRAVDDTGIKDWANRKAGVFEMFENILPTIAGLQEPDKTQVQELETALPQYSFANGAWSEGQTGEYCTILYLTDSLALEDEGTFWLSETPEVASILDGCYNYRICHWAKMRVKSTGTKFLFLNTHLENGSQIKHDNLRAFEMQVIKSKLPVINPENLPWIMVGDLNTSDTDAIFEDFFIEYGMKSARATARRSDNSRTFNNYGTSATAQYDHIFYSGFPAVSQFGTVTQKWANLAYISDHYPVYAIMRFDK
jgi:endonuclease/exonuclease/phosphatase family metal-dependent hydrolase